MVNGLRQALRSIGAIGTKTVFWPLVLANGGTLICLISGRGNVVISGFGVALAVLGLILMARYARAHSARNNSSNTKAL